MYWLSSSSSAALDATPIQLPLSADPVERSKQLLIALIAKAPAPERRTLAADATLLAFYIQPDGTAIADFSDELSSGTPSGILSEQLAVDSIRMTLGANVDGIRQLKILIHGQEVQGGNSCRTFGPPRTSSPFPRQLLQIRRLRWIAVQDAAGIRCHSDQQIQRLPLLRRRNKRHIESLISRLRLTVT